MDYNTSRPMLILPEYGRNIHQMIKILKGIEDRNERNEQAKVVIDVMSSINPSMRNREDLEQHLWTHLMIMAEFDLDIDIPVTIPEKEKIYNKPEILSYPKNEIKIRHYGRHIVALIDEMHQFEDEALKLYSIQILNQMKKDYMEWNKDLVSDEIIINDFKRMAKRSVDYLGDIQLADVKIQKPKKKNNKRGK
jgi:hypothetical protein